MRRDLKVLVIEDSSASFAAIRLALKLAPSWSVVGQAADATAAAMLCASLKPDVATLDLNIPGAESLELLSTLRWKLDTPVVVVSASTYEGSPATAEALMRGAETCFDKAKILLNAQDFLRALNDAAASIPRRRARSAA